MKLSNIRKNLKEFYLDIYFRVKPLKYIKGEKIFLTTTDGLGDNIVRTKLLEKFLKEYGSDNIVVLCKDKTKSFLEKLGFKNIIIYDDNHRKRVSGKIKLIEKIAKLGINRIVSLEFDQHDIFIKYLKEIKKIGYYNKFHEEMNKYYDYKVQFNKEEYILKQIQNFYQEYFNEKIELEGLIPNIEKIYKKNIKYKDYIVFGIGSIDRKKMLCSNKIVEFLKALREITDKKIVILGKGKLEEEIIAELKEKISFEELKIENLVNRLSLEESLEIINEVKYYVGMDSGLYNFAFGFRKKILAFFAKRNSFSHDNFNWVTILYGENENIEKVGKFGTSLLNSIVLDKKKIENFMK